MNVPQFGEFLSPEDYQEPRCPLCGDPYGAEPKVKAIPQKRIRDKLDSLMDEKDYSGVRRLLDYWLEEARLGRDQAGELMVLGEMIGFFRKTGKKEEAFLACDQALAMLELVQFRSSLQSASTLVNAATAFHAFGESRKALPLFERAKTIFEASPGAAPELLGGLYNNMALVCTALGQYDEAHALYDQAMDVMQSVPGGVLEQAITCLNSADALCAQFGMEAAEERIFALLDQAWELLKDPSAPHNGYYAFVCEKCAPSFSYYGYFAAAEELEREAERFYGSQGSAD